MTSETGIPELITGTIALLISGWLFPSALSIQNYVQSESFRSTIDITSNEYIGLELTAAILIFAIASFLLIGFYCYMICFEKIAIWVNKKRIEKLTQSSA
jgi:hypothetical protein